jgi:hypothetical protein
LAGHQRKYRRFDFSAFLIRLFAALFIVFSTYNPSGFSYYHWVVETWPRDWLLQVPILPIYLVAYALLLRATFRGLRPVGIILAIALMGTVVWLLLDIGVIRLASAGDFGLILLYMLAGLLAAGVSWMRLWTRLTGQASYDDLTQ